MVAMSVLAVAAADVITEGVGIHTAWEIAPCILIVVMALTIKSRAQQ